MPPTHGKPSTYTGGCRCDLCRKGHSEWAKGRYELRREERLAYNRAQYHKHREARREAKFFAAYGITYAERDAMLASQGGACAICGIPEAETPKGRLDLDHCHRERTPRGLLCNDCNRAIGMLSDDPAVIRAAAEYLERPRAA